MNSPEDVYRDNLIQAAYALRDGRIISKKQFNRMTDKILELYERVNN